MGLLAPAILLAACASAPPNVATRLDALLPADAILLGEQHDAPEHQRLERAVVEALAARGVLAAVALEMAEQGRSTQGLARDASEAQAQAALQWSEPAWPWAAYGPVVMAAVRAGVPVLGANLPRGRMRDAMADARLDRQLAGPALKAQQQQIRRGHCDLLPESQIAPMTRVQIARDQSMAATLAGAAAPGRVVLLLAGSGHVDQALGVPRHLPSDFNAKTIRLLPERAPTAIKTIAKFDAVWDTPAVPDKDHCAELARNAPLATTPSPGP